MEIIFYKCDRCANVLIPAVVSGATPSCCGETMKLLKACASDGAAEKHVPVIEREEDGHHITVRVGSAPHPMTDEHYIDFVLLAYGDRFDFVKFDDESEAVTRFCIKDNSIPLTAFAFCNLHALWKAKD